jgi:hypothetical protein
MLLRGWLQLVLTDQKAEAIAQAWLAIAVTIVSAC